MEKLKIYVSGADIHVTVLDKLTSGTVGATASFSFSPEWGDLLKTAVFEGSGVSKDVILTGSTAEIPPECLARRGILRVGVYGHLADGTEVIPTVMANGVEISAGTKPSGDTQSGFTPDKWAQMLSMIGDISHLTTEDRSTLVAAINEIAGYKGMELDDDQINAVIEYYFEKHPPTIGEMAMTGDLDMDSHRVKNVAAPEADADAVNLGYLNKNCAPAGYGLGGDYATVISDANLAITTGKYATDDATLNLPVSGLFGVLDVASHRTDKMITQKFYPGTAGYQGCVLVRVAINGTWEEWEWENPPMVPGVVYRTTERSNGKVVYACRMDCGAFPNATFKTFDTSWMGATSVVRSNAMMYDPNHPTDAYIVPYFNNGVANQWINVRTTNVYQGSTDDATGYNGYVNIYCTTD